MPTVITTIQSSDLITNSRTDINNNFASLNTNKIETSVIDTDVALAANSDSKIPSQKAVKAYVDAGGNTNASTSVRGIVQEASATDITAGNSIGSTGARLFVNPSSVAFSKFGGTGADGALSVTSGVTTIDLGGAAVFVKNYTSVSITGTGSVAFSNPHANGTIIIIKSQGACTLTTSGVAFDTRGMGAAGGAGGAATSQGTSGNTPNGAFGTDAAVSAATAGGYNNSPSTAPGGAALTANYYFTSTVQQYRKSLILVCGSGGSGGGGATNTTGGAGGNGGGALYIECRGAWNFTTGSINTSGNNGVKGGNDGTGTAAAGGGGAGSAGMMVALVGSITANSGTVTCSGGVGGAGGDATGSTGVSGGGGGGAGSINAAGGTCAWNAAGGAGAGTGAGGAGSSGKDGSGSGSAGGASGGNMGGYVAVNTEF